MPIDGWFLKFCKKIPFQKCRIQVRFKPKLKDEDIRKEAVRMLTKTLEARAQQEYREALQREKEQAEAPPVSAELFYYFFRKVFCVNRHP